MPQVAQEPLISYPEILTNKNWQKMKGLMAKVAGETGVGKAMDAVQAGWGEVTWQKFDVDKVWRGAGLWMRSLIDFELAFNEAKKEFPKVEKVRKALFDLEKVAEKTAAEWAKNKLIPKSATEHAKKVAAEASRLATALKSLDRNFIDAKKKHFEFLLKRIRAFPEKVELAKEHFFTPILKAKDVKEALKASVKRYTLISDLTTFFDDFDKLLKTCMPSIADKVYKGELKKEYTPLFEKYAKANTEKALMGILAEEAKKHGSEEKALQARVQEIPTLMSKLDEVVRHVNNLEKVLKDEMTKVP